MAGGIRSSLIEGRTMSALHGRRGILNRGSFQFSLGSLLLIMIWLSAGLGLMRLTPWIGVPYVLATLPAVIRTCRYARRSEIDGLQLNNRARVRVFLQSLEIVARLATTSLALVASLLSAACVWVLIAATRCCRHVASVIAPLSGPVNRLLRRIAPAGNRYAKMAFRAFSQRRGVIVLWGAILLACAVLTVGSSIALAGLVAVLTTIEFVATQIAKARAAGERLGRLTLRSTTSLLAADNKLLWKYLVVR